jgi:hypothetical protein
MLGAVAVVVVIVVVVVVVGVVIVIEPVAVKVDDCPATPANEGAMVNVTVERLSDVVVAGAVPDNVTQMIPWLPGAIGMSDHPMPANSHEGIPVAAIVKPYMLSGLVLALVTVIGVEMVDADTVAPVENDVLPKANTVELRL